MLFMESYLCYCSVRLGVLIVAALNMLVSLTFSVLLFARGVHLFDGLVDLLENDPHYKTSSIVRWQIHWIREAPDKVQIFLQLLYYIRIASAVLGIVGALRLQKWLLLPLAFQEFVYLVVLTACHIVLMIVLKKQLNLGLLIVLTLVGSFYCLFAGYNCVTCVAMFQIINLVRSTKYRQLYGEDPFRPLAMRPAGQPGGQVQQLRMLGTPEDTDIDEQKRLAKLGLWPRRQPQVISVIPLQGPPPVNLKWWQQQALDRADSLHDSAVYRNWQRDELLQGVGGEVERKNALNRRYAELQRVHMR